MGVLRPSLEQNTQRNNDNNSNYNEKNKNKKDKKRKNGCLIQQRCKSVRNVLGAESFQRRK